MTTMRQMQDFFGGKPRFSDLAENVRDCRLDNEEEDYDEDPDADSDLSPPDPVTPKKKMNLNTKDWNNKLQLLSDLTYTVYCVQKAYVRML